MTKKELRVAHRGRMRLRALSNTLSSKPRLLSVRISTGVVALSVVGGAGLLTWRS